jgi:hypothetical protein
MSTGNNTGRMGTRSSNSSKHPGLLNKTNSRRTSAEVKAATEAKVAAKKAKEEAHEASIQRVAEFETNARTNEELADATPRPNFVPRVNNNDSKRNFLPQLESQMTRILTNLPKRLYLRGGRRELWLRRRRSLPLSPKIPEMKDPFR